MATMLETALVLVLDDAEPFDDVRRDFSAATIARGIPFHVTLLYPFAAVEELTETVLADARSFFAARQPFEFELTRIDMWPTVVYAVPEPDAALRECMEALHARFPDRPPYGGAHAAIVPHATLGEDVDAARVYPEVERRLAPHLPLRHRADMASLLEESAFGAWRVRERFPFGG
jgi:2'-5' RNA ligase